MRWQWSNALVSTFRRKYVPVFEALGWKVETSSQVTRHIGGLERGVVITIFREGSYVRRHLIIVEVDSREGRWIRVASEYDGMGTIRKSLDEFIWKSFYRQCNRLVEGCIIDLLPKGSVKFSLSGGLELSVEGKNITLSLDQLAELPKIAALLAL
jgi:hypothetical protein